MARAAIRWHKQGKGVVSAVSPGSPVRLWIDGPADADTKVEVFQIAERAIARALRKLFRSPGAYVTNLPIDPAVAVPSGEGVLSTEWRARQALQTAGVDPEVELRVLTFDAPELALDTYIEEVAEVFAVEVGDLFRAFSEVNAQWLEAPVSIDYGTGEGAHLEAGESFTTAVRLYAGDPGSTLMAFAAVERIADELRPLAISDLIGLTVDEYGLIYRDF